MLRTRLVITISSIKEEYPVSQFHGVEDLRAPEIRDNYPYPAIRGVAVPNASRKVPEIVCPFPAVELHPEAERLKRDNMQWIIDNGMAPPYPGVSEADVLERVRRHQMPDLHARMWCDAPRYECLALADKLLTFFWLLDDCMDDAWSDQDPALRLEYVEAFRPILWGLLPGPCRNAWGARSLITFAKLWIQVRAVSAPDQLKRHAQIIDNWLNISVDKGGELRRRHEVPTVPYILRDFISTHGMDMFLPWNEIALDAYLPDDIYQKPSVSDSHVRFMSIVCWYNDIYGFNRDMASGEAYNLIAALMVHDGKSLVDAVTFLVERVNSEMASFDFMARSAQERGGDNLERYTAGLKKVVRAMLEWHVQSGKYDWTEVYDKNPATQAPATQAPRNYAPLAGPTGLGTSAAHLPAQLAARRPPVPARVQ